MTMEAVTRTEHFLFPRQSVSSSVQDPANSPSLSQLVATLVPALGFAALYFAVFLILRTRLSRAYSPRTFLGTLRKQERTPELPRGLLNWFGSFFKIPDDFVLNHSSLDGYLLLRYLKISVVICLCGTLLTWSILFPVNATGGGGQEQLNRISFSNVGDPKRCYAHAVVAWVFYGFVFYMVMRENIFYIHLRQVYLLSPVYANRMSSRTVLFQNVPEAYRDEALLRRMFGSELKNVWIVDDCSELQRSVKRRDNIALKLEKAEIKLIKMANKARLKQAKKTARDPTASVADRQGGAESGSVAAQWVPAAKRPTHRLKFLIGEKVDTIEWCRKELTTLIPKVEAQQNKIRCGEGKHIGAVFIEFHNHRQAQSAYSSLTHHQALHMAPRFIGLNPEEIIWQNLGTNWALRVVLNFATSSIVIVLLIFWAVPVAFIGALSNIKALSQGNPDTNPPTPPLIPWLKFINKIPSEILGVVQGFLPSILLAGLMAVLPVFLYWMARLAGKPSRPSIELRVQNTYFFFQVIQVFLVTTISSGAAATIHQIISQPTNTSSLLAQNLPKASNFYISYFILQGLAIASSSLAQVLEILVFVILGKILDHTPRQKYKRFINLSELGWGTEFPVYTLLTVIALSYAMIAPLVLGFATIGLFLIYQAYRYNLLFVVNSEIDTQGLVYPRALQHTTTGCYLGIICLIGLFAAKRAPGALFLMIILLICCILFHYHLNSAISPLLTNLPRSLAVEEESLLALEKLEKGDSNGESIGIDKPVPVTLIEKMMSDPNRDQTLKKPNMFIKFLLPHKYADYYTLRRLVPNDLGDTGYEPEVERDAYFHPAIKSCTPVLWIPRDIMGVSEEECRDTNAVGVPMSDDVASLNEKGKIIWDREAEKPPIYEEKIYY